MFIRIGAPVDCGIVGNLHSGLADVDRFRKPRSHNFGNEG